MPEDISWLIARETPRLRRYARALVKDATRADDLVQDALERALRKRNQVRKQSSLRGWLLRIVYTVYLNGRKSRYAPPPPSFDDSVFPHPSAPARQLRQLECATILEAIDQLPAGQRDAILLVALEGLPYDQAAKVLGVEVGTLKSRLSRGREALRDLTGRGGARDVPTLRRIK
ncbi:MAG TPA: sigma-70 family RNA polymerase sigma factor [Kiloniellales bacterium]|nr:sigma-70 family RNA polymerase sigma factor [Kiloniellales bacterium]